MVMVFPHESILLLALPLLMQVTCAFVEIAPKNQIYSNYYNSKSNTPSPTVVSSSTSFPQGIRPWKKNSRSLDFLSSRGTFSSDAGTDQDEDSSNSELEVVLFGVGDLRIHDHEGLWRAISKCHECTDSIASGPNILFLFVLDEDLLQNIPGMSIHTIDTATMLWSALQSMDQSLRQLFCNTTTSTTSPSMIQFYVGSIRSCIETLVAPSPAFSSVTIHVCDLGEADNSMHYNPYSALLPFLDEKNHLQISTRNSATTTTTSTSASFKTTTTTAVKPWTSRLREEPWEHLSTLPDTFTEYRDTFITCARTVKQPLPAPLLQKQTNLKSVFYLPNSTQFTSLEEWISFITKHVGVTRNTTLESERHTGLFGTHWGSIRPNYCSEHDVHSCWDVYNGKEEEFWKSVWYQSRCIVAQQPNTYNNNTLYGNERSLEHAAINWMLNNNNNNPEDAIPTTAMTTTQNLMDGELFLRYMAAPLLFGCMSIRQLHYYAATQQSPNSYKNKNTSNNQWLLSILPSSSSTKTFRSLLTAAESREWHNLFAASCLLKQKLKYQYKKETTAFQYWRWQGFLCRYITTASTSSTDSNTFPTTTSTRNDETSQTATSNRPKLGLVLLHGFGASGGQWEKMISEIYQRWDIDTISHRKEEEGYDDTTSSSTSRPKPHWNNNEVITFAPDLIGFGQSEKPFITYTQYLWESYASAFVKEIVFRRRRRSMATTTVAEDSTVQNYIIGGNSIGGYTAMACAADDSTCTKPVSSDITIANTAIKENIIVATASGSPGIGRCIGLVLFNSAGRILTKQDIEGQQLAVGPSLSIAQATSQRRLPKCR